MRKWGEFMMWNHLFMFIEVIHGIYKQDLYFAALGAVTTILSSARHFHHEKKYNLSESIVAKSCLIYNTYISITTYTYSQNMVLLCSKGSIVTLWMLEEYNYEVIHPWLHILVSIDIHLYLSYH